MGVANGMMRGRRSWFRRNP